MIKFLHLYKYYWLGFSMIGLIAFAIQEIPYMLMPLIRPESNPIMNMQNEILWLERLQGAFGMLSMVLLMLIVREDAPLFSFTAVRESVLFGCVVAMILLNFVGWAFYYLGYQYGWLIVISQFAAVPLYYLFIGLWQRNFWLAGTAVPFFIIHTINGYFHFIMQK